MSPLGLASKDMEFLPFSAANSRAAARKSTAIAAATKSMIFGTQHMQLCCVPWKEAAMAITIRNKTIEAAVREIGKEREKGPPL